MPVIFLTFSSKQFSFSDSPKLPFEFTESQIERFSVFKEQCLALDHAILLTLMKSTDIKVMDWRKYQPSKGDVLLFREIWDYFQHGNEFKLFLDKVERLGLKCLNPVKTMRWNMDKNYLNSLESKGVRIPPTYFIPQDKSITQAELRNHFQIPDDQDLVLKPTVSAGSYQTYRFLPNDATFEEKLLSILEQSDAIAQPFLKEISTVGEYSIYFIGGVFSHSVIKKPKSGHWFVQITYGGTSESIKISSEIINTAMAVLEIASDLIDPTLSLAENFPIARVDGIIRDNQFLCCELEVIEPFLDLQTDPSSFAKVTAFLDQFTTGSL
jgi:glutathione synthase/RimK-type ligase-like ATP-grasp enzyme